jgi:soluble lytic murein transglycosylase-like protein
MYKSNSKIIKGLSFALVLSIGAFLMVGNALPVEAPSAEVIEIETENESVLDLKTEIESETEIASTTEQQRPADSKTKYDEIIAEIAEKYGVSAALIKAIIKTESNFNPTLISATNDYGLMQINACNVSWLTDELGVTDLFDPAQNIESGVYILSGYLKRYSLADALMAYNCGEGGAKRLWKQDIHFTHYTKRVLKNLDEFGGLYE